ncbi:MAG TPA: hypothetical protein VMK31_07945, partial [Sphingomicrobium sp.]|nr:hypothetical protein [Sphingomicrobium sp.]
GLIRTASALCEAFLGQMVIERRFNEVIPASSQWQRLEALPVRSIAEVTSGGIPVPLSAYATDIDSSGHGWVRITDPAIAGIVEVSGTAGIAASQNAVPEPIRQGVLRLVAHLFGSRDGDRGEIPAAVTALWRPYRRMRLR